MLYTLCCIVGIVIASQIAGAQSMDDSGRNVHESRIRFESINGGWPVCILMCRGEVAVSRGEARAYRNADINTNVQDTTHVGTDDEALSDFESQEILGELSGGDIRDLDLSNHDTAVNVASGLLRGAVVVTTQPGIR